MRYGLALFAGALCLSPGPGLAHGGGLDGDGCHNDRTRGGYHCHRGPLAGQFFANRSEALATLGKSNAATSQDAITGRASVIDGDTLEIAGKRIRLHGIDAPESGQSCKRPTGERYRCGQAAALALSDRIGGAVVACETRDIDRYKRIVAVCRAAGVDLNGWMVSQGWAIAYRQYSCDYVQNEEAARSAGRGIWGGSFTMPDKWRRGVRD